MAVVESKYPYSAPTIVSLRPRSANRAVRMNRPRLKPVVRPTVVRPGVCPCTIQKINPRPDLSVWSQVELWVFRSVVSSEVCPSSFSATEEESSLPQLYDLPCRTPTL